MSRRSFYARRRWTTSTRGSRVSTHTRNLSLSLFTLFEYLGICSSQERLQSLVIYIVQWPRPRLKPRPRTRNLFLRGIIPFWGNPHSPPFFRLPSRPPLERPLPFQIFINYIYPQVWKRNQKKKKAGKVSDQETFRICTYFRFSLVLRDDKIIIVLWHIRIIRFLKLLWNFFSSN